MPKITKEVAGNHTTYYFDGIKRYEHYKSKHGEESWKEYDHMEREVRYKNNSGIERYTDYYIDENLEEVQEEEIKPFEFEIKKIDI